MKVESRETSSRVCGNNLLVLLPFDVLLMPYQPMMIWNAHILPSGATFFKFIAEIKLEKIHDYLDLIKKAQKAL